MIANSRNSFRTSLLLASRWILNATLVVSAFFASGLSLAAQSSASPQNPTQSTAPPAASATVQPPTQDYLVYVVCESADRVVLIRFGPKGFQIEHETRIGLMPMDINGPHGIAISPDKQYLYVSVGHSRPD